MVRVVRQKVLLVQAGPSTGSVAQLMDFAGLRMDTARQDGEHILSKRWVPSNSVAATSVTDCANSFSLLSGVEGEVPKRSLQKLKPQRLV